MPAIVNYEVYVLEGTEWSLHARFPGDERKRALDEAVNVENQTGKPAKVLRETWYTESNTCDESLAYISPRAKQIKAQARAAEKQRNALGGFGAQNRPDTAWAPAGGPAATVDKRGAKDFLLRLSMVMVSSLILAILGTGLASLFIGQLAGMGVTVGPSLSSLLFLVFIAVFLLSAVPLTMAYVPLEGLERDGSGTDDTADARSKAQAEERERDARRKAGADDKAAAAKAEADAKAKRGQDSDEPAEEDDAAAAAARAAEARQQAEARAAAQAAAEAQAALKKATELKAEEQAKAAEQADKPAPQGRDEPEPDQATLKYEQDRARMMKFIGAAVRVLRTTHPQLDAFNKFGVNLFLSGAADVLCQKTRQSRRLDLLRETIEVIGTKPKMAETFVAKLDEYMEEPRYVAMAQAGGRAMEQWLAKKGSTAFDELPKVMTDWNRPATKAAAPSMITIVFTDMVGSTDLTQEVGDAVAQEAVRAHNTVVRSVLARLDGREVKHTGDGIMATFAVTANAVAAAIEIQRRMAEYNADHPEMPVRLRIGMNSGEPIAEENDYFGATVQLASRLCNFADVDQIVCAAVTRDLCAGKPFSFSPLGTVQLKGVKEPVEAYVVPWQETADTAAAAEPSDPTRSEQAKAAAQAVAATAPGATSVKPVPSGAPVTGPRTPDRAPT